MFATSTWWLGGCSESHVGFLSTCPDRSTIKAHCYFRCDAGNERNYPDVYGQLGAQ